MNRRGASPSIVQARIQECMAMMRALRWVTGKSGPELAKRWGLSVSMVEHYAVEARRNVAREVSDPDRVTATVGVALEKVLMENTAPICDHCGRGADAKVAVMAAKTWADVMRAIPMEIAAEAMAPWNHLSPGERLDRVNNAIAKLNSMRESLSNSATAMLVQGESVEGTGSDKASEGD